MSAPLRVEVRVTGCLAGDLLALVDDLGVEVVPRHTVLTVGAGAGGADLLGLLTALDRAGIHVDEVTG